MIEREVIEFVAAADWTDDCRIRIELKNPVTKLTIAEERAFRRELDAAIDEAARGADELQHEQAPAPVDLVERMSPDCAAGKQPAGWQDMAWSDALDAEVLCECPCHHAGAAT